MLFRIVLATMTAFTVLAVNAQEIDAKNKQSFELASNPDMLYQPWPGPGAVERQDIVPPPPPGPYMSSALSGLNKGFSGEPTSNTDTKAGSAQPSPLMRPNAPWPVTGEQPKIWSPEKGVAYAPESNQPAAINQKQGPRMYHRANDFAPMNRPPNFNYAPQNNFSPPQMTQQQMQERMQEQMKQRQEQQKKMQEQMKARQNQQQEMQEQARQPQVRPPQMPQQMQEQQKKMQERMKARQKQQQEMQGQMRQPQVRPPQMQQRMQEQQKKMQELMKQRQKQQQAMQGQMRQPQARQPQMPQRMQEQQKKMQELMKQRQKQQQAMQEKMRQHYVRPPQMQQQMNRQQPVWKSFDIPMSNYPGPQQRVRQPLPR